MPQTQTAPALANPFPGLRTFEAEEAHLFFGREAQTDELLRRLSSQRFVAVVGVSGSGKSSLVRAGLLPALHGGFLATGRSWRQVLFRPGDRPIQRLAESLSELDAFTPRDLDPRLRAEWVETSLRRSGRGLVEATRLARLAPDENLLIVVDQFEELFRYHPEEASAFVKLLLEAVHQSDLPIYIVITMRSDYLGNCAKFRDLPETLNNAQYLVPRMTRDQRRLAIEGPVLVGGGAMSKALLNRLLNDTGEDPDRLPVLQHALMRTWDHWASSPTPQPEIDVDDYVAVGEMSEALSRHANGAYDELGRLQPIAATIFKRLTERDADHREVRRPASVGELRRVADVAPEQLYGVLEAFLRPGRSFLTRSPAEGPLRDEVTIDISHESLIRCWSRLRKWAEEEAASGDIYCRLADAAERREKEIGAYLVDQDLEQALAWRAAARPNPAWAERYGGRFAETIRFLDESRDITQRQLAWQTWRRRLVALLVAALVVVAIVFTAVVDEVQGRRRAQATQYLTDAYATAERGDFLRAAHLFGRAADTAVDEDVRRIAMLNVWQYAGSIVTSAPLTSTTPAAPIRVSRALGPAGGATLTWSNTGQVNLWRETDGQFKPHTASHENILGAALSDDGAHAATWDKDGNVRVWQTESGLRAGPELRHDTITGAAFAGSRLVTWGNDGVARLWTDPRTPRTMAHGNRITNAVLVSNDRWLVTWTDAQPDQGGYGVGTSAQSDASSAPVAVSAGSALPRQAKVWDLRTGAPLPACGTDPLKVIAANSRILTLNFDGTASFCDLESGRRSMLKPSGAGSPIADAVFDPDDPSGATWLTWSPEGQATVWRPQGGVPVESLTLSHPRPLLGAGFIGSGNILSWDPDAAFLWPTTGQRGAARGQTTFARETSPITGVEISRAGAQGANVAIVWRADGSAKLWDATGVRLLGAIPGSATLDSVEFSRTGHSLLLRDRTGRIRTLAVDTASPELDRSLADTVGVAMLGEHAVLAWLTDGSARLLLAKASEALEITAGVGLKDVVPDSTGRHVLAIDDNNQLAVLATDETAAVRKFSSPYSGARLAGATINAHGTTFLTWPGRGVNPLDYEDSTASFSVTTALPEIRSVAGPGKPVRIPTETIVGATFSPDGRYVVTWGTDGGDLWNAADGKPVKAGFRLSESSVDGAIFNKDSSLLVAWGLQFSDAQPPQPFARLWRLASLTNPVELAVPGPVAGGVFDTEGRLLAMWTSAPIPVRDGTGYACRIFDGNGSVVRDMCFGGIAGNAVFVSGSQLLVADANGSASIWTWSDKDVKEERLEQTGSIGGALAIPGPVPLVVTWSGATWRLWNSRGGAKASAVVRQSRTILDAQFDSADRTLRTWDSGGTMRTWKVEADEDLPARTGSRLFSAFRRTDPGEAGYAGRLLMALSGSWLDADGNLLMLEPARWAEVRGEMIRVLDEHTADECAHDSAAASMRRQLRLAGPGGN